MKHGEVRGVRGKCPTGIPDRGFRGGVGLVGWSLLLLHVVTVNGLAADGPASKAPEHQVKSQFLCNFPQFVAWPTNAFASNDAPLVIGVMGEDPFGQMLDQAAKNRTVQNRKLVVKRCNELSEIRGCHLLFISASETRRLKAVIAAAEKSAVLTVGDTAQFARRGGVINLKIEESKVRFEINPDAANRAGLRISAQLLKLGEVVSDDSADMKK